MIQQIRTVAHARLSNKAGALEDISLRDQIKDALREYFEL
jgi:mRNA-degrading endonuclease toxin of MazEF toxin-antitoxin module